MCDKRSYGYSIQDGQVQIVEKDGVTPEQAILLTPDTGLVGSPEPGKDGITKFRSLLQPGLRPARRVQLQTSSFNGFFAVRKVTHSGDTHGADWFSDVEARAL